MINLEQYPDLDQLVETVLDVWPEHESLASKSLDDRSPEVLDASNRTAGLIQALAAHQSEGLKGLCSSYQFLCEKIVLPEELHFRRSGAYRLSRFADALREVYANAPF